MKIISFNVRGLGRGIKWGSIRRMVIKETVGMLCLQETKKEAIDKALCQALWGYSEVKWELNPTINSPGGMLCLWSEATFKMENKITGSGFIFLQGIWHGYGERVVILNIYSPCDVNMKRILWDQISIENIGTDSMPVDPFTKGLVPRVFHEHIAHMSVVPNSTLV